MKMFPDTELKNLDAVNLAYAIDQNEKYASYVNFKLEEEYNKFVTSLTQNFNYKENDSVILVKDGIPYINTFYNRDISYINYLEYSIFTSRKKAYCYSYLTKLWYLGSGKVFDIPLLNSQLPKTFVHKRSEAKLKELKNYLSI